MEGNLTENKEGYVIFKLDYVDISEDINHMLILERNYTIQDRKIILEPNQENQVYFKDLNTFEVIPDVKKEDLNPAMKELYVQLLAYVGKLEDDPDFNRQVFNHFHYMEDFPEDVFKGMYLEFN